MKILGYALAAAGAVSLCACTVAPSATAPSAIAAALPESSGYEPAFFRAFLQNGYESPARLEPIRLLRGPLRVYMRTQDNDGAAIDQQTLDSTERILIGSAAIWSGETFGVLEVVRGTGTREKAAGWLTVRWSATQVDRCGRSTVGVDGGFIEFNSSGMCSCGTPSLIYPRLIRHELGHAVGYYHTDAEEDVMYGHSFPSAACDVWPSARERLHAKLAYSAAR